MQNNNEITELHEALLVLLKKFDDVCSKNDIQYSIGFGTMLGAIRHKGFIPWDDDVDIIITRKEFEKLCALPASEFEPDFFFQTVYTDKGYPYNTARLRLNNSAMIYERWKKSGFHQGIYIDIITMDNMPDNAVAAAWQKVRIIFLSAFRFMMNKEVFFGSGKNIPVGVKKVMYTLFSRLPLMGIYKHEVKVESKYKDKKCSRIGFLGEGNLFLKNWYPAKPIPADTMVSFIKVPFEDTELMCSSEYERLLKQWYGDYMKLPPEEKRVIYHHPEYFSRTVSYEKYLERGE